MVSETGHSSSEAPASLSAVRQAKAIPSQMWEALTSGAIGMHVFTWNDRDAFTGFFLREKGFGIVNQTRLVKDPVYWNTLQAFRRMENIRANQLFGGSSNAPKDIQLFWSIASDMGWNRDNVDNGHIWGTLKRLGYQSGIIYDDDFENGAFTNAPALLLSRCYQLSQAHLDRLVTNVVTPAIGATARRICTNSSRRTVASPQEDEFALCASCLKSPATGWAFPARRDHYARHLTFRNATAQDIAEWRAAFEIFLKKLTWKYRRPLILKSPQHTARIRLLLELFPARNSSTSIASRMPCFNPPATWCARCCAGTPCNGATWKSSTRKSWNKAAKCMSHFLKNAR